MKREDVLKSLGLSKTPELVPVHGQVSESVAATLGKLSEESGLKEKEIVGLAVTDWVRRAERKLKSTKTEA